MKKYLFFFITFFLFGQMLFAAEENKQELEQMRLASDYFKIQEFSKARDIYQGMLQQNLQPWKRSVIMFNLAMTLIGDKKWKQAEVALGAISMDNSLAPLLRYRIIRNKMLAAILEAESTEDFNAAKQLLENAIQAGPLAMQASCYLQQAEGEKKCAESNDIVTIVNVAKTDLFSLDTSKITRQLTNGPFNDAIKQLIAGNQYAIENEAWMEKITDKTIMQKYQNVFTKELENSVKAWTVIKERIEKMKKDPDAKRRQELFHNAESKFTEASSQTDERQKLLGESNKFLGELLKLPPPTEQKQPEKEQQAPDKTQKAPAESEMKKVLQTLQEMEKADEGQRAVQPITKKVAKPW